MVSKETSRSYEGVTGAFTDFKPPPGSVFFQVIEGFAKTEANGGNNNSITILPMAQQQQQQHYFVPPFGAALVTEDDSAQSSSDSPSSSVDHHQEHHDRRPRSPPPLKYNFVQFVNMPKTHVDHTYRDFSDNLSDHQYHRSSSKNPAMLTFHEKLYRLLNYTASNAHLSQTTIAWCSHGRAFRIIDRSILESSGLINQFFGYTSLRRFEAHIRHHGYKPLTRGPDAGCYYSEFLLRDMPHLLKHSPPSSDRYSQQLPDPPHEPDLYEITRRYPLPANRPELVQTARDRLLRDKGIVIQQDIYERACQMVKTSRGFAFEPDLNNLAVIAAASHSVSTLLNPTFASSNFPMGFHQR